MSIISKSICEIASYNDLVIYRAICECSSNNHDITIHIEYDKESKIISLIFYTDSSYSDYHLPWYVRIFNRVRLSLILLFTGSISLQSEFILSQESKIEDFILALNQGLQHLRSSNSDGPT